MPGAVDASMPARPVHPGRQKNRRRTGQAATVLISTVLHASVFTLMFSAARGDLVSAAGAAGGAAGPAVSVTLVRLPSPSANLEPMADLSPLAARLRNASVEDSLPIPAPTDEFRGLADRLAASQAAKPKPSATDPGEAARRPAPRPLSEALGESRDGREKTDGETTGSASTGELWGRVAPCWRNIARRNKVAVTLEVSLDSLGGLRTPPKVLRASAAIIDEPRLQSESGALAALAACLPRNEPRFGNQVHRLEFPAAR